MYPVVCKNVIDLENNIQFILEEIKWKQIIRPGERVLVKPNLLTKFTPGVTTTPEVLSSTIEILKDRTDKIFVVETDSSGRSAKWLSKSFNLEAPFLNLSDVELVKIKGKYRNYDLPKIALKSKIVNIPVLKTHTLTKMTLGIKNLFGLLPDKEKERYHWKMDKVLFDLYSIFRPDINILDGIYTMDRDGPMDGRIIKNNIIAASTDALSLDTAVCGLVGLNPLDVSHLALISRDFDYEYELFGDGLSFPEFEIPNPGRLERTGALLQNYTITRQFLRQPIILKLARKVKAFLA